MSPKAKMWVGAILVFVIAFSIARYVPGKGLFSYTNA